jgi:hypothetical protein
MTPEQLDDLHASVYRNTGEDPMWLGYWLKQFVESEEFAWSDLAQQLGTSTDKLVLLCLCRTPRPDHFQEDLRVVCERTGAREVEVARIVRQEQAMMRWREDPAPNSTGWFLAASDRDESTHADQGVESRDDEG